MIAKKKEVSAMGGNLYKEMKVVAKKFVSQKEGAELYSMGLHTFRSLADEAGAVYKVGKLVLVNTEVFEEYLETFRVVENALPDSNIENDKEIKLESVPN